MELFKVKVGRQYLCCGCDGVLIICEPVRRVHVLLFTEATISDASVQSALAGIEWERECVEKGCIFVPSIYEYIKSADNHCFFVLRDDRGYLRRAHGEWSFTNDITIACGFSEATYNMFLQDKATKPSLQKQYVRSCLIPPRFYYRDAELYI